MVGVFVLDWDVEAEGSDLFDKVLVVADHMSGAHPLALVYGVFAGCGCYYCWEVQDIAC